MFFIFSVLHRFDGLFYVVVAFHHEDALVEGANSFSFKCFGELKIVPYFKCFAC